MKLEVDDREHVLAVVAALVPWLEREPLAGRLWIAEEDRLRIRSGDDTA
jgi:hypothetical protein